MDSYTEPVIEFTSCSYLPEYTMEIYNTNTTYGNETATNTHVNTGDFAYDIAQIALTQVGYLEKESNSQLDSKTANAGVMILPLLAAILPRIFMSGSSFL